MSLKYCCVVKLIRQQHIPKGSFNACSAHWPSLIPQSEVLDMLRLNMSEHERGKIHMETSVALAGVERADQLSTCTVISAWLRARVQASCSKPNHPSCHSRTQAEEVRNFSALSQRQLLHCRTLTLLFPASRLSPPCNASTRKHFSRSE